MSDAILAEDAHASVPRALVGALQLEHGFARAHAFIRSHIITPSVLSPSHLIPLLKFTSPTLVLSSLLHSYELPRATHRLLKESGRLTAHPTFLSGVYSGSRKLGEGYGSSIRMSEWRASEDALRRFYLSREAGLESAGLPSDQWVDSNSAFKGLLLGKREVLEESRD
jgi:large subunit ribosomal protein L44